MTEIPKLKRRSNRRPININLDLEVDKIYRKGKDNGHDVSEFVRRVTTKALMEARAILLKPAEDEAG